METCPITRRWPSMGSKNSKAYPNETIILVTSQIHAKPLVEHFLPWVIVSGFPAYLRRARPSELRAANPAVLRVVAIDALQLPHLP